MTQVHGISVKREPTLPRDWTPNTFLADHEKVISIEGKPSFGDYTSYLYAACHIVRMKHCTYTGNK